MFWMDRFVSSTFYAHQFFLPQMHFATPLPLYIATKCFSLGIKTNFFCQDRQFSCLVDLFTTFSSQNSQCSGLSSLRGGKIIFGTIMNLECFHIRELLLGGLWIHTRLALFAIISGFIFNLSVTRNTCFCVSLVFTSVRETANAVWM
jgi:hypothetical protein